MGNCLAGDTCIFSHDPSHFMNRLSLEGSSTPPLQNAQSNFQFQDFNAFPTLPMQDQFSGSYSSTSSFSSFNPMGITPPPGFRPRQDYASDGSSNRSRPSSRHQPRENSAPALDDNEAFPSLGAVAKGGKKHHGKRGGHGHTHKDSAPSSLADVVKMAPSPGPGLARDGRRLGRNGSSASIRNGENSAAAQAIPSPEQIPWLATGDKANKAYLKARQDAIKHGGLRNKFLQR